MAHTLRAIRGRLSRSLPGTPLVLAGVDHRGAAAIAFGGSSVCLRLIREHRSHVRGLDTLDQRRGPISDGFIDRHWCPASGARCSRWRSQRLLGLPWLGPPIPTATSEVLRLARFMLSPRRARAQIRPYCTVGLMLVSGRLRPAAPKSGNRGPYKMVQIGLCDRFTAHSAFRGIEAILRMQSSSGQGWPRAAA
jgi:hypothetical protein